MRILHYNIFEGGGTRVPDIAAYIRSQRADIVGILEANGWEAHGRKSCHEFSALTALPFFDIATTASGFSVATFTHQAPARFLHVTEGLHHAVTGAVYRIADAELAVVFYHANPFSEEARTQEAQRLTALLRDFRFAVVMGDFNALSAHDPYPEAETLAALRARGIQKFGVERLSFAAMDAWDAGGMIDAAVACSAPFTTTTPTPFTTDAMHAVPVRIDYALVTPSLVPFLENITVLKDEHTDRLSDHYPVLLILRDIA